MKIKKMLGYNFKSLVSFELLYKVLSAIIFVPLFLGIFRLITKVSGYEYLTLENIGSFLLNPLTLLFLIILILILTFYTLIDISTVIVILDMSYQSKKITVKEAFVTAISKSLKVFKKGNILLPFLILFLIPFLNIGLSSGVISTVKIPEFITDFIRNNSFLSIIYLLFLILLLVLLFRWLYSLHYFILEDKTFKEARKESIKLSKKNKLKDFFSIIGIELLITIVYLLYIFIGIVLIILFYKWFGNNLLGDLAITTIWLLIAISFAILTLLATPISFAIISFLFYHHKEKQKIKIVHLKINSRENKKVFKKIKFFRYVVIILVILSGTLLTYEVLNGHNDLKIEHLKTMEVTAHRGASVSYPENTMSAFKGAKKLGSDWIELDVQQTRDGELIVLHDPNLRRTTGVNKNTWEATYAEIKDLDAGSFFNEKFKDERIPLLEDVIKYAKENNIKLNIELKPTGNEKDFEKQVGELIKKYDFMNNVVVTSQVYKVLENFKAYDQNIKTVYVMSLAYGDITNLTCADSFSIEASSVTRTLVNKIHNKGKEIYAWTVNTKDSIQEMVDLNVDNIITDNITLAKDVIYQSKTSNLINEYVKFVQELF